MRLARVAAVFGGLVLASVLTSTAAAAAVSDAPPAAVELAPPAASTALRATLPPPPVEAPAAAVREIKPVGDVESEIRDAAKLFNLDPALVRAVAVQESKLHPEARSHRGAVGVMQMMPQTARELGYDAADLRGNIRAGAAYLSMMMETFNGDVKRALAAYNAGPGAVKRFGGVPPFHETRNYVTSIMGALATGAAQAVSQPLSTTLAQAAEKAVHNVTATAVQAGAQVAQAAGKAAAPLAAGAAPFSAAAAVLAAGVP